LPRECGAYFAQGERELARECHPFVLRYRSTSATLENRVDGGQEVTTHETDPGSELLPRIHATE
jgi:hypothetical protein